MAGVLTTYGILAEAKWPKVGTELWADCTSKTEAAGPCASFLGSVGEQAMGHHVAGPGLCGCVRVPWSRDSSS
jgi:hypothetical protein